MFDPTDDEPSRDTVMVTGAAGFIGSHLATALAGAGRRVVGVDRRWAGRGGTPPAWGVAGELAELDLDPLLASVSVVFHLAGRPGVRPSWDLFPDYTQDNILVTQRLLDACVRNGVPRVVIASSSSVYGAVTPMAEDQRLCPLSPYAVTKLAAEQLSLAYAARTPEMTVAVMRYFTVYGPGQRPDMLLSRALRSALTGETLRIFGDGQDRRDFTYVGDVVAATVRAAAAEVPGGVYNVGTGTSTSVNDLIRLIAEVTGHRPRVRHTTARAGDVPATLADLTRSAEVLGYRPGVLLRQGIAEQACALDALLERAG